jgi:predicted regulator of Ras-like GTPase activity (Roadblock/LC7/MglB family)
MDASQALADLTEISAQIESAVILDSAGAVVASSTADTGRAEVLARTAGDLLGAAEESTGGSGASERLVQLQAALSDGCVFVVRDEDRVVAAVTAPDPTVGLVFYDLKTCLRHAAGEELAPTPKARQGSKKAQAAAEDSEEDSTNGSG